MQYREVSTTREFLVRLETGADWRSQIESIADIEEIDAGWFAGLGAVSDAELWFYDQDLQRYQSVVYEEPLEVAVCVGNISTKDTERFAHTHAVCSRPSGQAIAGHLHAGTVFAGELYLHAFDDRLVRERDERTGLDLW